MLKYITIPLSTDCEPYCHYPAKKDPAMECIGAEMLSRIVVWAMKENLSIQFVYPQNPIPESLENVIESIDHVKIIPDSHADTELLQKADVIVTHNFDVADKLADKIYVVKTNSSDLMNSTQSLKQLTLKSRKVNVVLSDIPDFKKDEIDGYRSFLTEIADFIAVEYINGNNPQLNLITDRMLLKDMNNCNAGEESIAVSIDGTFYPCPAFMGEKQFSCGDIESGIKGVNIRLYSRSNAPICKICDAFHCKRCVWLNNKLTHEVNTPGWQQCYISHLEREASKKALDKIRKRMPDFLPETSIRDLKYSDPYSTIERL